MTLTTFFHAPFDIIMKAILFHAPFDIGKNSVFKDKNEWIFNSTLKKKY